MVNPYLYPGLELDCSLTTLELRRAYFHRVWGAVAKACGIDPMLRLTQPGRKQVVVMARYMAMYIATEGVDLNQSTYYRQLAEFFGRDRTSVYHAIRVVDNMLSVYGERWEYYQPLHTAKDLLQKQQVFDEQSCLTR